MRNPPSRRRSFPTFSPSGKGAGKPGAGLPESPVLSDPDDDPAKRTTAELVEQTNRRLSAGENIPPHVLRCVAEVSRIASGVWYRDSFGVDGRARKIPPGRGVFPVMTLAGEINL